MIEENREETIDEVLAEFKSMGATDEMLQFESEMLHSDEEYLIGWHKFICRCYLEMKRKHEGKNDYAN